MVQKKHWTNLTKMEKYLVLIKNEALQPYLPDTDILSQSSLRSFLTKHDTIYLKPTDGTGGRGIIRIKAQRKGKFLVQYETKKKTCRHVEEIIHTIKPIIGKKEYLIQQGIDLVSLNNRPMDFRVLVLRPYDEWLNMGVMGKVAEANKIVTNRSNGGMPIRLHDALKATLDMDNLRTQEIEQKLQTIAFETANTLGQNFRYVREIGLDVAIDYDSQIWILETNALPNYKLFKHAEDKALYDRIDRYIKHIRRKYKRRRV